MDTDDDLPLAQRYEKALREYLHNPREEARAHGYELARRALAEGCGLLELAAIHHQAMRDLAHHVPDMDSLLTACSEFFGECLSPFEMSHRGAQEGRRALRHLNEVLEGEIKRIAHALHDEAGQLLASVHIALADVAAALPEASRGSLHDANRLLQQAEAELRNLSHELRPTVLDNLGLLPALEVLAEHVAKRSGLSITVKGNEEGRLPSVVETALYRIVQEALNNVVKHAAARTVCIELIRTPSGVTCAVRDDGAGCAMPPDHGYVQGLGLIGIRERLTALGGSLRIVTAPQCGTALLAEIPLGG